MLTTSIIFVVFQLFSVRVSLILGQSICPTYPAGSDYIETPHLYSLNGLLDVDLSFNTGVDEDGNTEYCYMLDGLIRSPVLHVLPGDYLLLNIHNLLPPSNDTEMDSSATNVHFHGMLISPAHGQDDVLTTLVSSGQSFSYNVSIPSDHPPGIYWYHDHAHGLSDFHVLGGGSGALIVDGIENIKPKVAGLISRTLVLRSDLVPGNPTPGGSVPSWDLSLNFVPIPYPNYPTVTIPMQNGSTEFWRVVNAGSDNILNLQLIYDGAPQPLSVIALDGIAVSDEYSDATVESILIAPAARAEFLVQAPDQSVMYALLVTLGIDTGPDGDSNPYNPIATIKLTVDEPKLMRMPIPSGAKTKSTKRSAKEVFRSSVNQNRSLYFSEVLTDPNNPDSPTDFYVTVDGQTPTLYSPGMPPSIIATQGTIEDWTIANQALEAHEFHIHQVHFIVLENNGVAVPEEEAEFLDTVHITYWNGTGPYPSVKVRMDFTQIDVGEFPYHCHILEHEDGGMMAKIQILPSSNTQ